MQNLFLWQVKAIKLFTYCELLFKVKPKIKNQIISIQFFFNFCQEAI